VVRSDQLTEERTDQGSRSMYWHCEVAAMVLSQLPMNPITKQHVRESLRYATLSATGRPRYASLEAKRILDTGSSRSLVKEHAVPVSIVIGKVLERARPILDIKDGAYRFMPQDENPQRRLAHTEKSSERIIALGNLRAWEIAEIIREWAVLAWVTTSEDQRLRDAGLHKTMPPDWNGADKFLRYERCGIGYVELHAGLPPSS